MAKACFRLSLFVFICVNALPLSAAGQTAKRRLPQSDPIKGTAQQDKSEAKAEAEQLAREQQSQARALLLSLAGDAQAFQDLCVRARTLSRIAYALWETDAERGRELFRKAFEAAESADQESDKKLDEEIRRNAEAGHGFAFNLPPRSLPKVLLLVEERDPALAKAFREKHHSGRSPNVTVNGTISLSQEPVTGTDQAVLLDEPDKFQAAELSAKQLLTHTRESLTERLDHAKSSADRDALYFQLAFRSLGSLDLQAREYADKIEDTELRKAVRAFIDVNLAIGFIQKKQTEPALQVARIGDLTHLQKTWVWAKASQLVSSQDHQRALSLIDDALVEARRIEGSLPDRPRALLAVANALLIVHHDRAWDVAFEAVTTANAAEGFTGEDGGLNVQFTTGGSSAANTHREPDFDLAGIFSTLTREDYNRAVGLARAFRGEAPRAAAVLAIAGAVLNEQATNQQLPPARH
jgi:hypothetical protein